MFQINTYVYTGWVTTKTVQGPFDTEEQIFEWLGLEVPFDVDGYYEDIRVIVQVEGVGAYSCTAIAARMLLAAHGSGQISGAPDLYVVTCGHTWVPMGDSWTVWE